jgi:hypothetical protein
MRSGAAVAGASHLVTRGRRSGAALGRSKPPVAVLGLPLYKLRMLANYGYPNVTKNINIHLLIIKGYNDSSITKNEEHITFLVT